MIDLKPALENRAYAEMIDFLNRIAASGVPNEMSMQWLWHLPFDVTFKGLLDERDLTAKFVQSTGRYFVERRPLPGKR
jgi:hypothetical protein